MSLQYALKAFLTEPRRAPTPTNLPDKQHISLIYFTTTAFQSNTNDPDDIVYGPPTLRIAVNIYLRRDWSGYDTDMSMALSALGVTGPEKPNIIQGMHTSLARWWGRDVPLTLGIGFLGEPNIYIMSTLRSTFANLDSVFERVKEIMESESLYRKFNRVTDIMERMIISERPPTLWVSMAMESIQGNRPTFIPATKTSIEGLEKVTLDSADEAATSFTCVICQESLLHQLDAVEEETDENNSRTRSTTTATRLPCSHIFHETCIVWWLQNSHLCPLCRHQMPTAQ